MKASGGYLITAMAEITAQLGATSCSTKAASAAMKMKPAKTALPHALMPAAPAWGLTRAMQPRRCWF